MFIVSVLDSFCDFSSTCILAWPRACFLLSCAHFALPPCTFSSYSRVPLWSVLVHARRSIVGLTMCVFSTRLCAHFLPVLVNFSCLPSCAFLVFPLALFFPVPVRISALPSCVSGLSSCTFHPVRWPDAWCRALHHCSFQWSSAALTMPTSPSSEPASPERLHCAADCIPLHPPELTPTLLSPSLPSLSDRACVYFRGISRSCMHRKHSPTDPFLLMLVFFLCPHHAPAP